MEIHKRRLNTLLRQAREARGWRQSDLAQRMGVNRATIVRWEQGTLPERYHRDHLCRIFGLLPKQLGFFLQVEGDQLLDPLIPVSSPTLVGRNALLATIKKTFLQGQSVVRVALSGLPGVGKTTLAIALAHDPDLREHFPDGILWAGLGPEPNLSEIFSRWGTLFGVTASGMGTLKRSDIWARTLRGMIGARRFLIVLDDVWHVADATVLKVGGEHCAYLLTTRHPTLATEFASAECALLVPELTEGESVELLQQLAPPLQKVSRNTNHILARAAGSLPLALTLMGNYLRVQGASSNSRRLQMAIQRLLKPEERLNLSTPMELAEAHPSISADAATISLHTLIAVSDTHTDTQAQSALRALSIFPAKPNTFSEGAALAVSACPVGVLDALIDAGLLESSGPERYTLHQTIADYARTSRTDIPSMIKRLITYFISSIETHSTDYEYLEADNNNILSVLDLAYTLGIQDELVGGTCAFAPFLLARGLYEQAVRSLKRAHEVAQVIHDTHSIITCLHQLGMVAQKQGEYQQATTYYRDALILARELNNKQHMCSLLADLGWVSAKRGLYDMASTYAEEGLRLVDQIGDDVQRCRLLTVQGVIADNRGAYLHAKEYYQKGLIIANKIADQEQMCILLIDLGVNADYRNHDEERQRFYTEALHLARQMGHLEWQCLALSNLSDYYAEKGGYEQGLAHNHEALHLARYLGHREWLSFSLLCQGTLAIRTKDYTQAETALQEALTLAIRIEKPLYMCEISKHLGILALLRQEVEKATDYFLDMMQRIPNGQQGLRADAFYRMALVAAAKGDHQEARTLGDTALLMMNEINFKLSSEVRAWIEKGYPPLSVEVQENLSPKDS